MQKGKLKFRVKWNCPGISVKEVVEPEPIRLAHSPEPAVITPAKPTEEDYTESEEISNENMLCKLSLQCHVTRKHYD